MNNGFTESVFVFLYCFNTKNQFIFPDDDLIIIDPGHMGKKIVLKHLKDINHDNELVKFLIVTLPEFPDIRYFPIYKVPVVLQGSGIMINIPTIT